MAWIESHTTLREHPKRKRLSRLLGLNAYETVGMLHVWWWWVLDFAPEGDLRRFSDEDIADAIDFDGDAGALVAALTRSGFMDADRQVHDWDEFAEKWIARRAANRERMKAARAARSGSSPEAFAHVSATSGARDAQNGDCVGLPDQPTNQPVNQPTNRPTTPPLPPSPTAAKGERPRRNQRVGGRLGDAERPDTVGRGSAVRGTPTTNPTEVPADLAPATTEDLALWDHARRWLTEGWLPSHAAKVAAIVVLGRDPSGWLHLGVPPGSGAVASQPQLAEALLSAGDPFGQGCVLVEG